MVRFLSHVFPNYLAILKAWENWSGYAGIIIQKFDLLNGLNKVGIRHSASSFSTTSGECHPRVADPPAGPPMGASPRQTLLPLPDQRTIQTTAWGDWRNHSFPPPFWTQFFYHTCIPPPVCMPPESLNQFFKIPSGLLFRLHCVTSRCIHAIFLLLQHKIMYDHALNQHTTSHPTFLKEMASYIGWCLWRSSPLFSALCCEPVNPRPQRKGLID